MGECTINSYIIDAFLDNYSMVYRMELKERAALQEYMRQVTMDYFQMFYASKVWHHNRYRGYEVLKFPQDSWIFQEIICKMKPDFLIETGTYKGGTSPVVCRLV